MSLLTSSLKKKKKRTAGQDFSQKKICCFTLSFPTINEEPLGL